MFEISVNRFETHYRLPPAAFGDRRRLDQVRIAVLDRAVRKALAENGIGPDAELCIRSLVSTVRLRLDRSDESLTGSWSDAIAHEISRSVREGASRNVVFYHSRRQALLDFATGIARGDLRRAWAWNQLGLCRSRNVRNDAQAIVELIDALSAEAVLLIPTLHALAEAGWLPGIASRVTEAQWTELAAAALSERGRIELIEASTESPSPRSVRSALRVLERSKIAGAVSSTGILENAGIAARRAVAILAVLEAEPILISAKSAATTIGIIADAVRSARNQSISALINASPMDAFRNEVDAEPTTGAPALTVAAVPASDEPAAQIEPTATAGIASVDANKTPSPIDTPVDLRRRSLTRFGGLVFLLNIVIELSISEEISDHKVLGLRPFTWVMHQLAMSLVRLEPHDPAALAFAGLPPQTTPPSEDELPPNEIETVALAGFAARIIERLRLLLERPDEEAETLLEFVSARRAAVVADPGWIELRFSLDEVSTEIRRTGLDLDPGYVPWLGVVLKFVYE